MHSKTKIILGPPGTGKTHNLLNPDHTFLSQSLHVPLYVETL